MKQLFKILSVLLSVVLLFCACGKQTPVQEGITGENGTVSMEKTKSDENANIRLLYNEADGINPFFAKSYENIYLSRLLYSPLFAVSSAYEALPVIAESISINGKSATVKIKSGLKCHGAADITPADVVYSFNRAKNSYAYKASLESIDSASAAGGSVIFTSKFADSLVALKLTFPIVKSNTAELQSDVPSGYGEYYFYEKTLVSAGGDKPNVLLTSVNTADTSFNAYKIGNTDVYFSDLSDCNYTQLHGNYLPADLNNMVYLGFNKDANGLDKNIRSAIAVLLNSEDIVTSAYQGHAVACKAPCNPASAIYKENVKGEISLSGDIKKASEIIDRCGFTRYAGKALTNGEAVLSYSLIVNGDNKYRVAAAYSVADTLEKAGFFIEVKTLSYEDYSERIASGDFQMYIGEIKLDSSMDLSPFFTEDGALSKGIEQEKIAKEYFKMRSGAITYADFYKTFMEYHPLVPIAFRTGAVFSSGNFGGDFSRFPYDLYYNF